MKTTTVSHRIKVLSSCTLASFVALSATSAVASAHTKIISGQTTGTFLTGSFGVSSGYEPVGSGNDWHHYFSSIPANTGIFALDANDQDPNNNYDVYSWFDTNSFPGGYDTGGGGLAVAMSYQGFSNPDLVFELTNIGKVWYNTPVGPGTAWGVWTNQLGAVTGWPVITPTSGYSIAMVAFGGGTGDPWVTNADGNCGGTDTHGNSKVYNGGQFGSTWNNASGCGYKLAESTDCLYVANYDTTSGSGGATYLYSTSTTGATPWNASYTKRAKLLSSGTVTSMAVDDKDQTAEHIYFTSDAGDLLEWTGKCSTTGTVATDITHNGTDTFVETVTVDREGYWVHAGSENVYYLNGNNNASKQELWLY